MRVICILVGYFPSKSIHLYSITGNFLIRLLAVKASRDATRIIGDKLPTSAREPEAPCISQFQAMNS